MKATFFSLCFVLCLVLAGCGPAPVTATPTPAPVTSTRAMLTYAQLQNGFPAIGPVDETWLARPADAAPPGHSFEGRLELMHLATTGECKLVRGGTLEGTACHLPDFNFEFVQSGDALVPARRGLIVTPNPDWNYILEPGRVWQEHGDQGLARASFPFALVAHNGNGSRNGVMTFLFDPRGVSRVWYQVTQETTTGSPADFWGLAVAQYHPGPVAGAAQIRADFAREVAGRFPTRPIEQLASDYPGVDGSAFGRGVDPANMTFYGLVVNGVNYVGGCRTRFGVYPYCESLRAASYSTAKSLFVSLALMRLVQKYGPQVAELRIGDYVPEAAASRGQWGQVTFNNVLDMASGHYTSPGYMVDEEGRIFSEFFGAESYAAKIRVALDWPLSAPPGTRWNYRSSDTFVLVTALQNYLKTQAGPDADLFRFVVAEIYRPLGVGPGAFSTLRTSEDNWQGQALGSSGMWWVPDDLAKLTTFLNGSGGKIAGQQLLDPTRLAAALQRDPRDRGVDGSGGPYNDAFWSLRYGPSNGYPCEFWVAYMAGYSGNVVALLPNGISYYYFSDGREFTWDAAVREAGKIRSYCK